ncbi:sensor histidine kinase [Futiania mangrovi]|uniref:histidine kinase n=1 Tax=Futiania mangrovi TaxID=2959716 RepID=A0A9J6PCZ5_9PROT|nr:PAS domain-containing sensor histidine kinase [Futiania mangrovii]MCP1337229.1 PAS-domain containing protein [Futiania mangrovii]
MACAARRSLGAGAAAAGMAAASPAHAAPGPLAGADAATLVALSLALIFAGWAAVMRRRTRTALEDAAAEMDRLRATLGDLETVLGAGATVLCVFDGGRLHRVIGPVKALLGASEDAALASRADLLARLDTRMRSRIGAQIEALLDEGRPFADRAGLADGQAEVAITGETAGPFAVVRLMRPSDAERIAARLRAEREMARADAARLRALLDAVPMPMWERGPDGALRAVNAAYVRTVEATDAGAVVRDDTVFSLTGIEGGQAAVRQALRRLARKARQSGVPQRAEHFVVAGGERRVFEIVEAPYASGTIGHARDMTAEHEATQELARHVRAHAETLDSLRTAIAVFGPDKRLRFFNAAFVKLWQLDPGWLTGHPSNADVIEALRERRRLPEQADFRAWKAERLDLYTSLLEPQEDLWTLPDGRVLRVTARPHPLGGLMFVYEDVTDQLTLERSYRALAGIYSASIETLSEAVAVFGTDGRLRLFNPAFERVWGLSEERLQGGPHIVDVADWCSDKSQDATLWPALQERITALGGTQARFESRIETADGRILDCAGAALPDGATLLTFSDVSASVRVERALRERADALEAADRMKADFMAHVTYQLRTPLNAVLGFAEVLRREMFGPVNARQAEQLDAIIDASVRLSDLIDNILELLDLQQGNTALAAAAYDADALMTEAETAMADMAAARGVTLTRTAGPGLPPVIGDRGRLVRVLQHLLSNAIRYSQPGQNVHLGARREGGEILFSVTDTGIGMDPELQARVFDDFSTRRSGGQRRRDDGAGLGLAVVRRVVDLHGGSVDLESAPGKGTTVSVRLPAFARAEAEAEADAEG